MGFGNINYFYDLFFPLEVHCKEPLVPLNTEEMDRGTHAANQPSEHTQIVIEVFPENENLKG